MIGRAAQAHRPILGIGVEITVINVLVSMRSGRKAGNDPWRGNTLEWFTQSAPPENNSALAPRVRSDEPMRDTRGEIESANKPEGTVAQPVATGT